ncbi:hypothetical protein ACWEPB_22100 [Kitasatospora cineracea]
MSELPLHVIKGLLLDASLAALTTSSTASFRKTWAKGEATHESAQFAGLPDPSPSIGFGLRWLLLRDEETATRTYGLIAHQARHHHDIPIEFSSGWIASAIKWGAGRTESLPYDGDIDVFVQAATTPAALRLL